MGSSHTLHLLNVEPEESLEWAMEYVRIVDFFNIHAENLMSFVGSFPHVPVSDVEKFAQHSIVRSVALQMGEEQKAVAKYNWEQAFVAIAQHGISPAESNELERLMALFAEYSTILGNVEKEALEDASTVYSAPNPHFQENPEYVASLKEANNLASALLFLLFGEDEPSKEEKARISHAIRAYNDAVRSGVFEDVAVTKADVYTLGSIFGMNTIGLWILKDHLDTYADAILQLGEAEVKAFDVRYGDIAGTPCQSFTTHDSNS